MGRLRAIRRDDEGSALTGASVGRLALELSPTKFFAPAALDNYTSSIASPRLETICQLMKKKRKLKLVNAVSFWIILVCAILMVWFCVAIWYYFSGRGVPAAALG